MTVEVVNRFSVPQLLAELAAEEPNRPLITEVGGRSVTCGEFQAEALRWAAALADAGVTTGDNVVTMTEPSISSFAAWIGMSWLGAVDTGCNTEFKGPMLAYLINNAEATTVLVAEPLLDRVLEIASEIPLVQRVIVMDSPAEPSSQPGRFTTMGSMPILAKAEPADGLDAPAIWDTSTIVYTSGTTGPSKGVLMPWGQQSNNAKAFMPEPDPEGTGHCYYSTFPMYHALGRAFFAAMVNDRARLVLRRQFSVSEFWSDIRTYDCTITCLFGPMASFLFAEPETDADADNPLRAAIMLPVHAEHERFAKRFGVKLRTFWGMTEVGGAFATGWGGIADFRSCGHLRAGFEARLVDEHDHEVPVGEVGELVVRHDEPWTMSQGYFGMPDRTGEAWRNGWFHTGDALRRDDTGLYFFVDRIKDAIRRRGENISSFEVEALIAAHADVAEVAAVAAPSPHGEDEVRAFVVRAAGSSIDEATLVRGLIDLMPRFMVPRYVEFVDHLPRTDATQKVRKVELRDRPLEGATWDREAAGIVIPR